MLFWFTGSFWGNWQFAFINKRTLWPNWGHKYVCYITSVCFVKWCFTAGAIVKFPDLNSGQMLSRLHILEVYSNFERRQWLGMVTSTASQDIISHQPQWLSCCYILDFHQCCSWLSYLDRANIFFLIYHIKFYWIMLESVTGQLWNFRDPDADIDSTY